MVNRRLRPLLLNGAWDFLGVLFASSGFLLVVGPAVISGQYQRNLFEFSFGQPGTPQQTLHDIWSLWWGVWLMYYLLVLGGGAALLWWRSRSTVIYNVDAAEFERLFEETLEQLGLHASRTGGKYVLTVARTASKTDDTAFAATSTVPRPPV